MCKQYEQLDGWSVTPNVDDDAECRRRMSTPGDAGFPFLTRSTFLSVETRARADSERPRARLPMYHTRVFFKVDKTTNATATPDDDACRRIADDGAIGDVRNGEWVVSVRDGVRQTHETGVSGGVRGTKCARA